MSRAAVDQAVEQIRDDRGLAERVVSEGGAALGSFDLSGEEQTAIVDALRLDVEEASGEVSGFSLDSISWGSVSLNNTISVGRNLGGLEGIAGESKDTTHQGWIEVE